MRSNLSIQQAIKWILIFLGVLAVVALTLPLLGVAAFAVRIMVMVAVPVGIVALVVSPRLRDWLSLEGERGALGSYFGLRVPEGVMLHPAHSWAGVDSTSNVTVGADDLAQRALGTVETIRLPEAGESVRQGDVLFEIAHQGRTIDVRSPVSGVVASTNSRLADDPGLLNESPYDVGWAVKISPSNLEDDAKHLHSHQRARVWFRNEVDRLMEAVMPNSLGTSLAHDGGTLVGDFHDVIDDATWSRVSQMFFGE